MLPWFIVLLPVCVFTLICWRRVGKIASLCMFAIISLGSIGLYSYFGHYQSAQLWQQKYLEPYRLRQEFIAIGSVDQIIAKLQKKLAANPNDSKGWYLLGRLYQVQQREEESKAAFAKSEVSLDN